MAEIPHRTQTGLNAAHPPFYASESDPTTTLGAYRGWFKPTTEQFWIRNAANSAWHGPYEAGDVSTALADHLADTADAHDASAISILDTGGDFTATHVEGALAELAAGGGVTEIDDLADVDTSTAPPADGQTLIWDDTNSEWIPGSVAAGTVAAADVTYAGGTGMSATDAEAALDELATEKANASDLTDHISDTSAAHAASAISYAGGTGMSATNAEAAIDELATEKANDSALTAHIGDTSAAHAASAISILDTAAQYTATEVEGALAEVLDGLQAHEADTSDAHDATAISFAPAGSIAATNVQAAIEEAASEAGGGGSAHVIQDEGTPLTQRANLSFEGAGVAVTDDSGDAQTVVTIPGGGGSGYRTLVTLGSDVSNNTTSFADVTGLSFTATSGVMYRFFVMLLYSAATTAQGAKFAISGPASPTVLTYVVDSWATANTNSRVQVIAYDGTTAQASTPDTAQNTAMITGFIKTSTTGLVVVRFGAEVVGTAPGITVKTDSTLEYW